MESVSYTINKKKVNENDDHHHHDENVILKRRISNHPLYRLLLQSHIDCLKVGGIGELEIMNQSRYLKQQENKSSVGILRQSELDNFMEAYCLALGKLKEAIEEPQQKSMAFIDSMHSQLNELTTSTHAPAEPATSLVGKDIQSENKIESIKEIDVGFEYR